MDDSGLQFYFQTLATLGWWWTYLGIMTLILPWVYIWNLITLIQIKGRMDSLITENRHLRDDIRFLPKNK